MQTNTVIGYRVQDHNSMFVAHDGVQNFRTYTAPEPISQADAYRRLAAFIEENPGTPIPSVVPVYRQLTPLETTAKELGSLLTSLTERHGLNLGLSADQIERRIAQELCELGASPVMDRINGVLGR
jgi:hypothetical protein